MKPQPGPQTAFLETTADIAIYGGAAGGGKSYALLLEPLRHYDNPNFRAVLFRRTSPQLTIPGGLWPESVEMYHPFGAHPVQIPRYRNTFPSGMVVTLAHMQYEGDRLDWQGSQITMIGYDELTHFTELQFFYMLSRLRSRAGVPGYVRATTNPDAESWVRTFIDWWIGADGFAIPERSGVIRWMTREGDDIVWANSKEELMKRNGVDEHRVKSVTFIPATLADNKILEKADPAYRANLEMLPKMEREILLKGNWNITQKGEIFEAAWFEVVDTWPKECRMLRFWDLAGTDPEKAKNKRKKPSGDPDYTAGALLGELDGIFYICDMRRFRKNPKDVEDRIKHTADIDGKGVVPARMWQDPAQAGKAQIDHYGRNVLKGHDFMGVQIPGRLDQIVGPFASAAERGHVKVVRGNWNLALFNELEGLWEGHDDQLAAIIGAYLELALDEEAPGVHSVGSGSYDDEDEPERTMADDSDDWFWK